MTTMFDGARGRIRVADGELGFAEARDGSPSRGSATSSASAHGADPAGEPLAPGRARDVSDHDVTRSPHGPAPGGDIAFMPAGADAGLHGGSGGGRPRRHAERRGAGRGDPDSVNPLVPVDLVIDHSVQVDLFAPPTRIRRTSSGSTSATGSATTFLGGPSRRSTLPRRAPGRGICHQVNLEHLGQVVRVRDGTAFRTHWWGPTRTPRWSTGSACSAGASAGSRPRRPCSASR